jgi:hypothetical protein
VVTSRRQPQLLGHVEGGAVEEPLDLQTVHHRERRRGGAERRHPVAQHACRLIERGCQDGTAGIWTGFRGP